MSSVDERESLPSSATGAHPYPLLFRPILLEKVWGGRNLAKFGKRLGKGQQIGESWEIADLSETSPWGAGGGAQRSCVVNGGLSGFSLDQVVKRMGDDLIPSRMLTSRGGFPLLIKLLDASHNLSVQVHPSPAYAAANPGAHLKTECWYILDAEEGAVIYKGIRPGFSPEDAKARFERAVKNEDWATMINMIDAVPARPGECHVLPSGIPHALGKGVVVAEVQTPSDTTYRLWDWGRTERPVQPEPALRCIDYTPAPKASRVDPRSPRTLLAKTAFFTLETLAVPEGQHQGVPVEPEGRRCSAITVLAGDCMIRWLNEAGKTSRLALARGTTCLIPAAVDARLVSDRGCGVLRATPI